MCVCVCRIKCTFIGVCMWVCVRASDRVCVCGGVVYTFLCVYRSLCDASVPVPVRVCV